IEMADDAPKSALPSLENALSIYQRTGQRLGASWTAADLAQAYTALGDQAKAEEALETALSLGRGLGHIQLDSALAAAELGVAGLRTDASSENGSTHG